MPHIISELTKILNFDQSVEEKDISEIDNIILNIEEIELEIIQINNLIKNLNGMLNKSYRTKNDNNRTKLNIKNLSNLILTNFLNVKKNLKAILSDIEKNGNEENTAMRLGKINKVGNQTKIALQKFTNYQRDYKKKCFDRVKKLFCKLNENSTEMDIQNYIHDLGNKNYSNKFLNIYYSEIQMYEINERCKEIIYLESLINELYINYQEIQTYMKAQNEIIDINDNMDVSNISNIRRVSKEINQKFKEKKISSTKLKIIIVCILCVILAISIVLYIKYFIPFMRDDLHKNNGASINNEHNE